MTSYLNLGQTTTQAKSPERLMAGSCILELVLMNHQLAPQGFEAPMGPDFMERMLEMLISLSPTMGPGVAPEIMASIMETVVLKGGTDG